MGRIMFEIKFEDRVWFKGRSEYADGQVKISISGPRNELFRAVLRHELTHAFLHLLDVDLQKLVSQAIPVIEFITEKDLATTAGAELFLIKQVNMQNTKPIPDDLKVEAAIAAVVDQIKAMGHCKKLHKPNYYVAGRPGDPVRYAMCRAMNEAIANMAGWGVRTPGVAAVYQAVKGLLPPQIVTMIEVATRWPEDLEKLTDKQLVIKS